MGNHERMVSVSRQDWSFDRNIARDEARHNEKVKEAIKGNLDSVVSDGTIITADPHSKRKIKVPLRSLELPHIRYGEPKDGIGTGAGDGKPQPGDQVGKDPQAGDKPGEAFYEAEMTVDEIQKMVFEDLGLPNLKPREEQLQDNTIEVYTDIRKKRTTTNLDLGRTVMQNMMRNALETGIVRFGDVSPDDYRVRTWETETQPIDSAVVIAMADISGSMGEFEKYITRSFCWWTVSFLRTKYPKVDIVFIAHDTEAEEVSEEQFFTRGAGGGTKCSSANEKALEIIERSYPTNRYNVYPLHFSDGDNFESDNHHSAELVNDLLEQDVSQYAYVQIGKSNRSKLLDTYDNEIDSDRFKGIIIKDKADVLTALKEVFKPDSEGY